MAMSHSRVLIVNLRKKAPGYKRNLPLIYSSKNIELLSLKMIPYFKSYWNIKSALPLDYSRKFNNNDMEDLFCYVYS